MKMFFLTLLNQLLILMLCKIFNSRPFQIQTNGLTSHQSSNQLKKCWFPHKKKLKKQMLTAATLLIKILANYNKINIINLHNVWKHLRIQESTATEAVLEKIPTPTLALQGTNNVLNVHLMVRRSKSKENSKLHSIMALKAKRKDPIYKPFIEIIK